MLGSLKDNLADCVTRIAHPLTHLSFKQMRKPMTFLGIAILTSFCILALAFLWAPPTYGQAPFGSEQLLRSAQLDISQVGNMDIAPVKLDGRTLFQLASLTPEDPGAILPIQRRVRTVHFNLIDIVEDGFDPKTLEISHAILNNQTVIRASNKDWETRHILTVTALDVEISDQRTPDALAQNWSAIIRQALLQAREKRRPEYQLKQIPPSLAILSVMTVSSWLISRLQKIRRARYLALQQQLKALETPQSDASSTTMRSSPCLEDTSSQPPSEEDTSLQPPSEKPQAGLNRYRLKLSSEQRIGINLIARPMLQTVQVAIWFIGVAIILRRFPQLRNFADWILGVPIGIIAIPFVIGIIKRVIDTTILIILNRRADFIQEKTAADPRLQQRTKTLEQVLRELTGYLALLATTILFFFVIQALQIGLIAIATLLLLAQNVFQDFLKTYFILVEDQYGLGDIVNIQDVNGQLSIGTVEKITLRATQLRNLDGEFITISHSNITKTINLTCQWSQVNMTIDVAYSTDLDQAIAVIQAVAETMYRDPLWGQSILDPPEVLGVDAFGENSISIRLVIRTQPAQQWSVGREYRRRLKPAFDQAGISIPFPQRSIWLENALKT